MKCRGASDIGVAGSTGGRKDDPVICQLQSPAGSGQMGTFTFCMQMKEVEETGYDVRWTHHRNSSEAHGSTKLGSPRRRRRGRRGLSRRHRHAMSGRSHRAGFVVDFVSATQRLIQRNRVGKPLRLRGDQPRFVLLHLLPGNQQLCVAGCAQGVLAFNGLKGRLCR